MNILGEIQVRLEDGTVKTIPKNKIKEYFADKIICENGALFNTDSHGILPNVLYDWFLKRQEHTGLRKELGNAILSETDPTKKEKLITEKDFHDNAQLALKIMINSIYGLLGTPYSRWFDIGSAEAVTLNGQSVIHTGKEFINDILTTDKCVSLFDSYVNTIGVFNDNIVNDFDYIIAIDTDSLFINLGSFIKQNISFNKKMNEIEMINLTLEIGAILENKLNEFISVIYNKQMNITLDHPHEVAFKQEIVGTTGIFTTKKRYGIKIKSENGVPCDKTEVKGLETVRSDIPTYVRNQLKEFLNLVLSDATDNQLLDFVNVTKSGFEKLSIPEQSFPKGVNNISKYTEGTGADSTHKKGTPVQVKAAINFNKYIVMKGLQNKIPAIRSGSKIKWFYLKTNPYGFDTFGFTQWRPEFEELGRYIDIETMKEKLIDKKVKSILDIIGIVVPKFGRKLDIFDD